MPPPTERSTTLWSLVVMFILVGFIAFAATVLTLLVRVNDLAERNRDLNEQTAAIATSLERIADADGDGVTDTEEILMSIARFERFLDPPTEDDPSEP